MARPFLLNVSGPYAVGKDTVLNAVIDRYPDRVHRVRTITTRPVKPGDDPSYTQLSPEEFDERVATGRWLVNRQLGGQTAYGTSVDEIHDAAAQGLISVHSVFPGPAGAGRLREVFGRGLLSLGLLASHGSVDEQREVLRARLVGRGRDAPDAIEARLRHQDEPLAYVSANPEVEAEE
ncbi:MAG TPA: hypothetical protein VIL49_06745, partial [Capillimicrobium sp.]